MTGRNYKELPCAGCGAPTHCAAEAVRVLCPACLVAGRTFPRMIQDALDIAPLPSPRSLLDASQNALQP